jgi:hypothetical protein
MFNPVDDRLIRSMVDQRREALASKAYREQRAVEQGEQSSGRVQRARVAVGVRLIRVGAKIAGADVDELPRLRPGV